MTESRFWELLKLLDRSYEYTDESKLVEPVTEALTAFDKADMFEFDEILAEKLWLLDTRELGEDWHRDEFLFARTYTVARGREYYYEVLTGLRSVPLGWLERLHYVAQDAYQRKYERVYRYSTFFDYETGSNLEGWR